MLNKDTIKYPEGLTALEESRKRFGEMHDVTIKVSTAHLDFLKSAIIKPFEEAVQAEIGQEKQPATKAWENICALSEEEGIIWLVETAVRSYVNDYVFSKLPWSKPENI